jgi:hypothetical protein
MTRTVPAVRETTISRMCWRSKTGMIGCELLDSEWKRKT